MFFPNSVQIAVKKLQTAGYEAYPVGGCVRDFFLNRPCADFDITTNALPEETARVFSEFRVIETGIKHGTVTVLIEGDPLEITTYRIDLGYTDGRHPDAVAFTPSITEDLARRDFTINAMAYDLHELVDPFGGKADLEARLIRCVGDATTRFREDGLRILRALRFSAQLGFAIEAETARAMEVCKEQLKCISVERITEEIRKLVRGRYATDVVRAYLPILRAVLPDCEPNFEKLELQGELVRLAGLLGRKEALGSLRLPKRDAGCISLLLTAEQPTDLKKTLRVYGEADARLLYSYHAMRFQIPDGAIWSTKQLAVDGEDLKALGLCGTEIGRVLELLLDAVMAGSLPNDRATLLANVSEM